ncbi:hypothetical protein PM10SUCC1_30560 [Propionigenium maris DSM 9537]|uniref:Thioredoxin domain-containing protein n=1 Tax=Propionigenium maris DSM 9537 TaxID=1123000 RepID=A0A9W6LPG1_9FUSO|nr:TlpA disulfide reductase family protein [Propionigenium maris]GLI57542.1 hypothetical protein PM10SUCC1_30560 [Propionigenium maris DSM 9537]
MKRTIMIFLILLSTVAFGAREGLEKGEIFPKSKLYNTAGELVGNTDDYKGKITIYNFGTSWCSWCVREKPLLNEFYNKNSGKINVVSIMLDRSGSAIDKFFEENPADFPHFFDKGQEMSKKYAVKTLPTTYIVDEDGTILTEFSGSIEWDKKSKQFLEDLRILKSKAVANKGGN